ncbi:hypothetical protein MTR67_000749 [Solanum verrucosum]|uniref:Uncharacterized protein n=1 Tax=Solanum verrucosum TaxID=315347 RepID=A0AAF0PLX4_SOLVR|nr:hypothetical protein MTR67_000749 [Solanum verrucosum]
MFYGDVEDDMLDIRFDKLAKDGGISPRQQRRGSFKTKMMTHGMRHSWDGKRYIEEYIEIIRKWNLRIRQPPFPNFLIHGDALNRPTPYLLQLSPFFKEGLEFFKGTESLVKAIMHEHILHASPDLQRQIFCTVEDFEKLDLVSTFGWESETTFPNVLGDVIESLARVSVIFVDTGFYKDATFLSIRPLLE